MFSIVFDNLPQFLAWLSAMPQALQAMLLAKSTSLAQTLTQTIQAKLDGGVLNSVTGTLRDSITSTVSEDGTGVTATVSAGSDVPYAAIQEYGGTTKAHIIEALNAKTLAFSWQGKAAFFPIVHHPGSVIPERSYLRSSLDDMQDEINAGMAEALEDVISDS